ncbi:MAG: WbuC family cupin fold metalloprotein [Fibrobacterales bacterium]
MTREDITCITSHDLTHLSTEASINPRKRKNLNIHQLDDPIQRFFNALEPNTYIQPHRHIDPPKIETFIHVKGSFLVVLFNDNGTIVRVERFSDLKENIVMDIQPGVWHSLICEEPNTIFFEIKTGPYRAPTDKDFAPWSPQPDTHEVKAYLEQLHSDVLSFMKTI